MRTPMSWRDELNPGCDGHQVCTATMVRCSVCCASRATLDLRPHLGVAPAQARDARAWHHRAHQAPCATHQRGDAIERGGADANSQFE